MANSRSVVAIVLLLGLLLLAGASAAAAEYEGKCGARAASSVDPGSDDRSDAEVLGCAVWCAELSRVCINTECVDTGMPAAEVNSCAVGCVNTFLTCQYQCVTAPAPPPANE